MNAFLLSVALLGQYDNYPRETRSTLSPQVQDMLREHQRAETEREIQRRQAATQQTVATSYQQEDRTNTYILGGAIVVGLLLFGLMARGKKA